MLHGVPLDPFLRPRLGENPGPQPRGVFVKQLEEHRKFENHKHKESFIQDLSQTQKINRFSKESQDLIADLNNTEIFKLYANSSKQQCLDCNAYWEVGIICCRFGRNMKSSRSPAEFDQNNRDVASIPGHVIKKNSGRRAKHGPSERQKMYYQAKQMFKKSPNARMPSNDTFTMVQRRRIKKVIVSHRVERTPHNVVRQNRRGEAHLHRYKSYSHDNAEGLQQPLNKRSDSAQAKRDCKRLHDEHFATTQEEYRTLPHSRQTRQRKRTSTRTMRKMTTQLTLKLVGGSTKGRGPTCRQLRQDRGPIC